jgi:hypothetical protein
MNRKGYLIFTRLAEMLHTKIAKMEIRKTTKKQIGMKQKRERVLFIGTQFSILYTSMYSPASLDPYNKVIFGRRRPDSVVVDWTNKILFVLEFKLRWIKDEITENEGNLERGPSMTSSSETSRR